MLLRTWFVLSYLHSFMSSFVDRINQFNSSTENAGGCEDVRMIPDQLWSITWLAWADVLKQGVPASDVSVLWLFRLLPYSLNLLYYLVHSHAAVHARTRYTHTYMLLLQVWSTHAYTGNTANGDIQYKFLAGEINNCSICTVIGEWKAVRKWRKKIAPMIWSSDAPSLAIRPTPNRFSATDGCTGPTRPISNMTSNK